MREDNAERSRKINCKKTAAIKKKKERGERRMNRIKKMLLHDGGFYKGCNT
jgi:hypothetical protein